MTTPAPPEPAAPKPHLGYTLQTAARPAYGPATPLSAPAAAAAKRPGGFAIAALIVGIVALLAARAPVTGAVFGVGAIVLGIVALRRSQPKGRAITGIVLGSIAALSSIGMMVGAATASFSTENVVPATPYTQSVPDEEKAEPSDDRAAALTSATRYSDSMHMSRAAIYDLLISPYGGNFSPAAAQSALDGVQADWNANALASAKAYQRGFEMTPEELHRQLTSDYGGQFTAEEADYAIEHLND